MNRNRSSACPTRSLGFRLSAITSLATVTLILFSAFTVAGQVDKAGSETLPKPSEDEFTDSSELVIPWRDSSRGCDGVLSRHKLPGCPTDVWPEVDKRVVLTIYNGDGGLWRQFNIAERDFLRDDFKPLAPRSEMHTLAWTVILRVVGESPSWYKVEVNEETRETKYILKTDKNWAKITWAFIFNLSRVVQPDQKLNKLRDKPGGEIIKEYAELKFDRLFFEKLDGDWMYVKCGFILSPDKPHYGWIRWRNGREILVGSLLNDNKVPRPATNKD